MKALRAIGPSGWLALLGGVLTAAAASAVLLAGPGLAAAAPAGAAVVAPLATSPGGAALEHQLNTLLAQTLGPHLAAVAANVTLNRDRTSATRLRYGRGTALAAQTSSTRATGYQAHAGTTAWGRTTTITSTTFAPGAVRRIRLALIVSSAVPRATVRQLKRTLAVAAGLNRARGDTLSVTRAAFAPVAAPARSALAVPAVRSALALARWLLLGIGVLAFAAFARRDIGFGASPA